MLRCDGYGKSKAGDDVMRDEYGDEYRERDDADAQRLERL